MYAIPNFHRWVLLWLAVFFSVGRIVAAEFQITVAGNEGTLEYEVTGASFAWTGGTVTQNGTGWPVTSLNYSFLSIDGPWSVVAQGVPVDTTGRQTIYFQAVVQWIGVSAGYSIPLGNPQTVVVAPASAEIEPGQSVQLTASGGQTSYLWEVAPGSYGELSASSGAVVNYTASSNQGVMSVRVRAVADSGFSESPWAVAAITVGARYSTSVSIPANNTDYTRRWRIVQGSGGSAVVLADWFTQAPGASAEIRQFSDLPLKDQPVYVFTGIEGVEYLDGFWKETPGAIWNDAKPSQVSPAPGATPPAIPVPVSPGSAPSSSANTPGSPTAPPASSGSVWVSSGVGSGSSLYTGPSEGTFREGITKLERELKDANTTLRDIRDAEGGIGKLEDLSDENPTVATMQGEGASAGQAAGDSIPTVAQPGLVWASGSAPSFVISFPAVMGGRSVDLNPFRSDRFGGIMSWFRTATSWAVVVLFGLWASHQVKDWVKGASTINQARGNAVLGGTGAQATALVAAGIITVAVTVFLVGLVGWLGGNFALPAILGQLGVNPTSGLLGGALWMLDQCFPVALMISALVARVAWNFYASSIFAVAMTVIRFVVP